MDYKYDIAKAVLSATDKDRFLCCYLNAVDTNAVSQDPPPTPAFRTI